MSRPNTPARANDDGSTTITVKRHCNGCGESVGDATADEILLAMAGQLLPDVTDECGCEATDA